MNQRPIELYKEACEFAYKICKDEGRPGGTSDHIWNTLSTGRFAELIVSECIGVVNKRYMGDNNREDMEVRRCVEDVKKHFGVEE